MATIPDTFYRDGNRVPITNLGIITKRTITFDGGTTNGWGDDGGTLDGGVVFTVTGGVQLQVYGFCTTNLAGTGTHALGITGATTIYMPTELATDINAGDYVMNNATVSASPILGAQTAAAGNFPLYALNGQDIIMTIATSNITSGVIDYFALWSPLNDTGSVVASTD